MIHEIKCSPDNFEAIVSGKKSFEIQEYTRLYEVGDLLALNECNDDGYTGRSCLVKVDYIVINEHTGYIVMSIKPCPIGIRDGFLYEYNHNPFTVPILEFENRVKK